ncbi:uncharacterized protein BDW47DRAFT_127670 [Aspergillus candidus]|uniref:Carrier domain-containing protein n=1 Tax=Aspergillus candidus TaxID=41067 RepID=A0A2I2F5J1_ASPCN|nr:hypothetical protein BDW47DRAFT_127670 [Aspergillus candidus]PLB35929.1 hypothetical protein BDW47DRAFT_127670 [Aspergillus candidus]
MLAVRNAVPELGHLSERFPLSLTTDHNDEVHDIKDRLRHLWAEVLQDDPESFFDEDVFFDVGGDSVRSQMLLTAAGKQGIHLTMEQIFMNASLEEMATAAQIVEVREDDTDYDLQPFTLIRGLGLEQTLGEVAAKCNVQTDKIENVYPCSPMQEALVAEFDGTTNPYVRQFVFRLAEDLAVHSLEQAWEYTIRENPVLRTRICSIPDTRGYVQVVLDDVPVWKSVESSVAAFLAEDESIPMALGDRFFRYTIVNDAGKRYFVWNAHHALCDGASIPEVLEEVAIRFQAASISFTPRVPFAKFIQSVVAPDHDQLGKQEDFWKQSLGDLNPTPFPSLPQQPDFQVNPSTVTEHLIHLPQEQAPLGLTKALLLRAAWGILLSHYTGTQDIVFGAINSGRTAPVPGVGRMTGPTINLVPIALSVDPQQSVAGFLSAVRSHSGEMIPYEHIGISKIRQALTDRAWTGVDFQTLLVVHPMEFADAIAPSMKALGLEYVDELGKKEHHPYALIITCTPGSETTVRMTIQHDERVVSAIQAQNLSHQFQAVLTQLTESTRDSTVGSISPLSNHDLTQIQEWNKFTPPPEETCIHYLFDRQLQAQPDATAVSSLKRDLTYTEVDRYSNLIAVQLLDIGVQPGMFIGVCFEKSLWMVVAILAVFKAGGVYVPIEPTHPRDRISEVVKTAQIKISLASVNGSAALKGICDIIITVDGKFPESAEAGQVPPGLSQPSSLAYLLFTSGSTGKPKGILMSHQAICASILHHGKSFGAGPHWRTLQFGAHTFDLSIGEFFTTLAFGGCICVPSEEERLNNLPGAISTLNANTLLVVPTVANLLYPHDVPTLKTIVLAGEPITKETIVRWADHVELTAAYGPSETAVYCSGNLRVSPDADPTHIGFAIGATMWIANPENYHQLCAIGCVGEILISGPLLGSGYIGDKQQTDSAWVPAPEWLKDLSSSPYQTFYRSGDLARYNEDGTFRIVGRRDTQVKLGGYRIELGEIENQIMASGLVASTLVALPAQGPCRRQIVAVLSFNRSGLQGNSASGPQDRFTIARDRHSPDTVGKLEQLKQRLELVLPEYMVPTVWVLLEELPLLISGKIDRKAIKGWVNDMDDGTFTEIVEDQQTDGDYRKSEIIEGSLADTLRNLWCKALQKPTEHVNMRTSFFAIGGDSIAAIEIVSQAKKVGLSVTVRGIINAKTLGNLVSLVEQQLSKDVDTASPAQLEQSQPSTTDILAPYNKLLQARLRDHPAVVVQDAYLFAPMQREIQRQRQVNPAVFLLSWQMEIASRDGQVQISLERLAQAWRRVVQRLPILRSIFLIDPSGQLPHIQVVLDNAEPEIATVSISSDVARKREPTLESLGIPPVDECFLPHRTLLSQRGDRFFIHIELDHLVIDGWSLRVIKEALLEEYETYDNEYIPEAAPSYKDFVLAQIHPDRADQDRSYWTENLRNQPPALLSFHVSRPVPYFSKQKTILYLPEIPAAALTSFSVAHGITPANIFDAAWAQTLSLFTKQSDVGFEYVVSGRDEDVPGAFSMVGPLINVLAYHLQGVEAGENTTEEDLAVLATRMQDQRAQDSMHSAVNIREVVDELHRGKKLFNTAVNFQRRPTAVESKTLWVDDDIRKSNDPWHFDILVRVMHITDDNTFRSSFEFDALHFEEGRIQEVANNFWQRVEKTFSSEAQ